MLTLDRERILKLSIIQQSLGEKFNQARDAEPDSFRSLYSLNYISRSLSFSEVKKTERAIVLQGANACSFVLTSDLLVAAYELAADTQTPQKLIYFPRAREEDKRDINHNLARYPRFVDYVLEKAELIALGAVLIEMESGDTGLAKASMLPERSLNLLYPSQVLIGEHLARVFETQIPGVSFGISHNGKLPDFYFYVNQLNNLRETAELPPNLTYLYLIVYNTHLE